MNLGVIFFVFIVVRVAEHFESVDFCLSSTIECGFSHVSYVSLFLSTS